jgi:hypothetical protein
MRVKNLFYGFMFLFIFSGLHAQQEKMTAMQVLKKATEVYNRQEYLSYNSKYALYLDYTSKKAYEQYNGIVLKKNNVNYFKIKNTEFVAFKDFGVKINHDEKAIVIENGSSNEIQESPLSLENYLKGFDSKLILTNPTYFICELTPPKISQIMMSKVVLYIKKSDYSIVKQSLYFIEKMENKDTKGKTIYTAPRLEISFNPRNKDSKNDDLLVNKVNYFTVKSNQIIVSKRLSAYQLFKS